MDGSGLFKSLCLGLSTRNFVLSFVFAGLLRAVKVKIKKVPLWLQLRNTACGTRLKRDTAGSSWQRRSFKFPDPNFTFVILQYLKELKQF